MQGIGFWGPLYYNYNEEPQKIVLVIIEAPILRSFGVRLIAAAG